MVDAETFVASSTVVHGCVLTVLSNVVVSFAVLRAGAVAEQLLVVKVVKEPGNAFPAMIALVFNRQVSPFNSSFFTLWILLGVKKLLLNGDT